MDTLWPALETLGVFGVVLGGLALLAVRARKRKVGALLGVFEEIYHPTAVDSRIVIQEEAETEAPTALPGERERPGQPHRPRSG